MDSTADPVAYFLEDMSYHGRSERTIAAYERVLREFQQYLVNGGPSGEDGLSLTEASHRECLGWIHTKRGTVADSTIASYASYLHRFYSYMGEVGFFESNPMTLVMEEMDERIDADPARRDISIPEMQEFVRTIDHPADRAVIVTLLKTGLRAGELCNLDRRDLNLGNVSLLTGDPRPAIRDRPDSLFVSSESTAGAVVNGERRSESNKRKRNTVIPVDEELKTVLTKWLSIRPDPISPADPVFVATDRDWGTRLRGPGVHYIVEQHARANDWYESGADAGANVTPHYFRHFFTTHLRDRTGDRGIVKYLRGDVANDVIDTYTHNWGNRVREVYENDMYQILGHRT